LIAVESLLVDFEVRAVQKIGWKVFDRETDGLGGLIKSPVSEWLASRYPSSGGKELGCRVEIKFGHGNTILKININMPECASRKRAA
jgi:hypothetical protein